VIPDKHCWKWMGQSSTTNV